MKKLFTSMGLAAMSLFAAAPTFAQQSLTANQAETVVKTVFPAVMEQVKLASGLDIQAIAEGNMDWTLYSRIPTVTVQPDSAHINVSALIAMMKDDETDAASSRFDMSGIISSLGLDKMKISFSDYQKINYAISNLSSEISLPGTTAVDLLTPGSIKILIEAEPTTDANATMPFKKLVLKSEIDPFVSNMIGGAMPAFAPLLQSGTILTVSQSSANGINTVTSELSETGLVMAQLISGMMDDDNDAEITVFPKFTTATDMTKMATDKYYTVTRTDYLPNGTAIVDEVETVYNPTQTLPLIADSIVTKSYENDGTVDSINKRIFKLSSAEGANGNTITKVTIDSLFMDGVASVTKDSTVMQGNLLPLDHKNITMSIIQSVIADMAQANKETTTAFHKITYLQDNEEDGYKADNMIYLNMLSRPAATTAEKDTLCSMVVLADANEDGVSFTSHTGIEIDLVKDQAIISVQKIGLDDNVGITRTKIATLYAKSNLLSIATDNEEIAAPQSDVTFGFTANGIYVNNCKQGRYTIVDMNGRIVANGVIAGEGAFVATPQLTRGSIYVIAVQDEKGLVKAAKFAK